MHFLQAAFISDLIPAAVNLLPGSLPSERLRQLFLMKCMLVCGKILITPIISMFLISYVRRMMMRREEFCFDFMGCMG